jgi:hypothetical protein
MNPGMKPENFFYMLIQKTNVVFQCLEFILGQKIIIKCIHAKKTLRFKVDTRSSVPKSLDAAEQSVALSSQHLGGCYAQSNSK